MPKLGTLWRFTIWPYQRVYGNRGMPNLQLNLRMSDLITFYEVRKLPLIHAFIAALPPPETECDGN